METQGMPAQSNSAKTLFRCLLAIAALSAVFVLGRLSAPANTEVDLTEKNLATEVRQNDGYTFINPLLECDAAEGRINKNIENFRNSVESMITKVKQDPDITHVSVYFRDLNNGPWFGVNEKTEFLPASLLKLPTSMSFLKLAESKPAILQERVQLKKKVTFPLQAQIISPSQEIEEGKSYTIEDLINRSLIYSDNQAAALLYNDALPALEARGYLSNSIAGLQSDLDVLAKVLGDSSEEAMSVKNYSALFRVLFNASFLNRDLSEKLLKTLSLTEYSNGLVAGVPEGVTVAHKFGEAGQVQGESQLHDCGIIYYPNRPYILCVMTRGSDMNKLVSTIQTISANVYQNVDKQTKTGW